MKRYVRTIDDRVFDTTYIKKLIQDMHPTVEIDNFFDKEKIVCETDDIKDLLQVGDIAIVMMNDDLFNETRQYKKAIYLESGMALKTFKEFHAKQLIELYTKQGNDFILVWTKKGGVVNEV